MTTRLATHNRVVDLGRYLHRIGYEGSVRADRDTLAGIMRAHLHHVPFENLDIHRHVALSLDIARLFEKVVDRRRGGFCYELNGLLSAALDEIGFSHSRMSCRVLSPDHGLGPPFDHLALGVQVGGELLLVDVGFGEGLRAPMSLSEGTTESALGFERRIERRDSELAMIQVSPSGEESGFVIDETPRQLPEFAQMCLYHQSSDQSPFTQQSMCTLATADGRITLSGDTLKRTSDGNELKRTLSAAERDSALSEYFGIDLG